MGRIVELLLLIASLAERVLAKIKATKRQEDADALHDDPRTWYVDHFSGMLDDDEIANETAETDADD
jgi:hypothetical protein